MKKVLILVCFLIVLSGIGIASAETLTGTLGASGSNSTLYSVAHTGATASFPQRIYAGLFQNTEGTESLILFFSTTPTYDAGAPAGATTPFTAQLTDGAGMQLADGTMGYQRLFNTGGTEIPGYLWLQFNNYSTGGNTGNKFLFINYSRNALYNVTYTWTGTSGAPVNNFHWILATGGNPVSGDYNHVKDVSAIADYTATKPAGIGIEGTVTKTEGSSQAFIFNASGTTITSQSAASTDQFNFTVPNDQIIIGIYTSGGIWYNSSVLFSAGTGTPNPTVTPTTAPTIAPGYVRTNVWVMDHLGNAVHGVDIAMYDVEGTTWSNSSGDADARHYIDTLPYHTLNLYADLTAFPDEFLPASLLGVETGYSGESYYLVMYPTTLPPGDGNVNLYVTVTDEDTGALIRDASLTATYGTTTQGGTSGSTGTEIFVVPNQTNIRITGSKAGYTSATQYLNSGTGTVINTGLELTKLLVTTVPTSTIPPGGVTTAVTVNPHDPSITGNTNASAQDMMNWLAANGMQLVQLCFLVTILGLLGIKLGK